MRIGHFDLSSQKRAIILKSTLWNTIGEVFLEKKNIDITTFISSIRLEKNILFIKFSKPLMKAEISLYLDIIEEQFYKKVKKMWIDVWGLQIKL